MSQIELKIYLKNHKKPLAIFTLSKESHLDEFVDLLNSNNNFVRFYNILFNKNDFSYAEIMYLQ